MKKVFITLLLVLLLAVRKDVLAAPTYTIPVVVHVLYNTGYAPLSNISDAQVLSQIDVLNQDFQLLNADAANVPAAFAALKADCQIQFTLAKRDPLGNATTGILHKSTTKTLFSQSLNDAKFSAQGGNDAWPSNQYLNIWLVATMVLDQKQDKGYAQAPGGAAATDGVTMYFSSFGTVGSVNLNSKGHMATHLVGHWLNLQHPWGPGPDNPTCTATDDVADTPPQSGPSGTSYPFTAPAFPYISCSNGPNGDLFMNFMDWTAEASRCMFTQGQKARMQAVLAPGGARASLASSQGGSPPCTLPVSAPTGLIVTDMTSTSITLNWNNTSASNYTLQWKPILGSNWITVPNIAGNVYTLPALTPGTGYSFKVLSNCSGTASAYSSELAFGNICPAPTGLNATGVTSNSATLNWTGVPSASNYTLQIKSDSRTTWTTVANISGPTYVFTPLQSATSYSFKVSSNCGGTPSAYSSPFTFTTSPSSCSPPTGVNVTSITNNSARVTWNSVPTATSYPLVFYSAANNQAYHPVGGRACCSYNAINLYPGTSYIAEVYSTCGGTNYSASSRVPFTTSGVLCSPPTLNVSNISTSSATLSWNRVSNVSSYALAWGSHAVYEIPDTIYRLNSLLPGTVYYCKIKNNCTDLSSAFSDAQFSFTTNFLCSAPTLSTNSINHNSATLNWTNPPSAFASSYTLQWKPAIGITWNTVANIPGNTYRLVDLIPGTNYLFKVSSDCSTGPAAYSNPLGFTTTGCPDNFEPNESLATARQISVNTAVSANIGTSTDKDYFKFTTSSNAPFVKLSLTNLPANYELQLYTSSGTLVGSSVNAGTTSETVTFNYPNAGTYYAYVYGNNGVNSGNCYNLKVQTSGMFGFKGNVPNTNLSDKFTLYPNPTRGEVSFEYDSKAATLATISIIDQNGRTCKTIQLKLAAGQNKPVFNISDLSKGFYYVRMVANEETLTTKLFLER